MSTIGDELREFVKTRERYLCSASRSKLLGLADRIDAEMVELPKDANDEPILPGDTVYAPSGGKCTVTSLQLYGNEDPSWMASICGNGGSYISTGCELTHERHDSWERIADELEEWKEDNRVNGDDEIFSRAGEIANRIRALAGKGDER